MKDFYPKGIFAYVWSMFPYRNILCNFHIYNCFKKLRFFAILPCPLYEKAKKELYIIYNFQKKYWQTFCVFFEITENIFFSFKAKETFKICEYKKQKNMKQYKNNFHKELDTLSPAPKTTIRYNEKKISKKIKKEKHTENWYGVIHLFV